MNDLIWRLKLAAWTHDPAEKALVLLRDPAGHEWGTAADLRERIFRQRAMPGDLEPWVRKADRWASAADRPQWPRATDDGRYDPQWQVRFDKRPVLIHPLSGQDFDLKRLPDIPVDHIKAVSRSHFEELVVDGDPRKTALAFWRFGPHLQDAESQLTSFWSLLPADTRVPDHAIWQHLDLTAAFAAAMPTESGGPALLSMSFGPVQDFIAQARSTSDLWAGSHLLSRIAWEAMKVVCEQYGPDAILFPQLRGNPQVDLWLRDEIGLREELFQRERWTSDPTDANPLFAATLPNRFVAILPARDCERIAGEVTDTIRRWGRETAEEAWKKLAARAGEGDPGAAALEQLDAQLRGFPEVHWATVPWEGLIDERDGQPPGVDGLEDALSVYNPKSNFLGDEAWQLLSRELTVDGQRFFLPNPGALYPALYDLLDRSQAAAKSARSFAQVVQEGYRCSLCGEREWLTHDRTLLDRPPGQREGTVWSRAQISNPSWGRKGEHLCGLCTLKRLWPNLLCDELKKPLKHNVTRYVVSTHTMALATTLERWVETKESPGDAWLTQLQKQARSKRAPALPRRLAIELHRHKGQPEVAAMLRGLPLLMEKLKEQQQSDDAGERVQAEEMAERIRKEVLSDTPAEDYYALILMDGDRMGAWLSGQGEHGRESRLTFGDTWHPETLRNRHLEAPLKEYLDARRPVSPARHMAISSALNAFSLQLAPYVVEEIGKGKLLYAGGDDLLAMVSVDDLLLVMLLLRLAYGGSFPLAGEEANDSPKRLDLDLRGLQLCNGFAKLHGKLHRLMGAKATASAGAVVAHHQEPLGAVLRELRAAEARAKGAGRDAFSISVLKRSGGAQRLTSPWIAPWCRLGEDAGCGAKAPRETSLDSGWRQALERGLSGCPITELIRTRDHFAREGASRRAAYLTRGWLDEAPDEALSTLLAFQFRRQTEGSSEEQAAAARLGSQIGDLAQRVDASGEGPRRFLENFLGVAEFLAREGRAGGSAQQ